MSDEFLAELAGPAEVEEVEAAPLTGFLVPGMPADAEVEIPGLGVFVNGTGETISAHGAESEGA